jgi:hypothetical protein
MKRPKPLLTSHGSFKSFDGPDSGWIWNPCRIWPLPTSNSSALTFSRYSYNTEIAYVNPLWYPSAWIWRTNRGKYLTPSYDDHYGKTRSVLIAMVLADQYLMQKLNWPLHIFNYYEAINEITKRTKGKYQLL